MAINREKVVLVLALLIFVVSMATFIKGRLRPPADYADLAVHELNDSRQEVLRMEPRTHVPEQGAARDPFRYSSGWKAIKPECLPPPRPFEERRPRATFGWLGERSLGASIRYQHNSPTSVGEDKGDDEDGDDDAEDAKSSARGRSDDEGVRYQKGGEW